MNKHEGGARPCSFLEILYVVLVTTGGLVIAAVPTIMASDSEMWVRDLCRDRTDWGASKCSLSAKTAVAAAILGWWLLIVGLMLVIDSWFLIRGGIYSIAKPFLLVWPCRSCRCCCPRSGVVINHGDAVVMFKEEKKVAPAAENVKLTVAAATTVPVLVAGASHVPTETVPPTRSELVVSLKEREVECLPVCDDTSSDDDESYVEARSPQPKHYSQLTEQERDDISNQIRGAAEACFKVIGPVTGARYRVATEEIREKLTKQFELLADESHIYDEVHYIVGEVAHEFRMRREKERQRQIDDLSTEHSALAEGKRGKVRSVESRAVQVPDPMASPLTPGELEQIEASRQAVLKRGYELLALRSVVHPDPMGSPLTEEEKKQIAIEEAKQRAIMTEVKVDPMREPSKPIAEAKRTVPSEVVRESKQASSVAARLGVWPSSAVALALQRDNVNMSVIGMGFCARAFIGGKQRDDLIFTTFHGYMNALRSGQELYLLHGDKKLALNMDKLEIVAVTAEMRRRVNKDGTTTPHLGLDFVVFSVHTGKLATLGVKVGRFAAAKQGEVITCEGFAMTPEGHNAMHYSRGRINRTGDAMLGRHGATTFAGWSGCAVRNLNGAIVGIHTGHYGDPRWKTETNCVSVIGSYFSKFMPSTKVAESEQDDALYYDVLEDDFDNESQASFDADRDARGELGYDIDYGGATNRIRARGEMASTDDPRFMDKFEEVSGRVYTLDELEQYVDQQYRAGKLTQEQADYMYNNATIQEELEDDSAQVYDTDRGFSGAGAGMPTKKSKHGGQKHRKGDRNEESGDIEVSPQMKQMQTQMDSFIRHIQPRYKALEVQLVAQMKRQDVIRAAVAEFDAFMARGNDLLLKAADGDINENNRFDVEMKKRHYDLKQIEDRNASEIRHLLALKDRLAYQVEEFMRQAEKSRNMHKDNAGFRDSRKNELLAEMERRRAACEANLNLIAELRASNTEQTVKLAELKEERKAMPTKEAPKVVEPKVADAKAEVKAEDKTKPQAMVQSVAAAPAAEQTTPVFHEDTEEDKLKELVESPHYHDDQFKGGKVAESKRAPQSSASTQSFSKEKADAEKKAPEPPKAEVKAEEAKPKAEASEPKWGVATNKSHPWFTNKAWKEQKQPEKEFHIEEFKSCERLCLKGNETALLRMQRLIANKTQAISAKKSQEKPRSQPSSGSTKPEITDGAKAPTTSPKDRRPEGLHPWFTPLEWEKMGEAERKTQWWQMGKDEKGQYLTSKEVNQARKDQRDIRWIEELKVTHPETWSMEHQKLKEKDRAEFIERKERKQAKQDAKKTPMEKMSIPGTPEYESAQYWKSDIGPKLIQMTQIMSEVHLERAKAHAKMLPQDAVSFVFMDYKSRMQVGGHLGMLCSVIEDYNAEQREMWKQHMSKVSKTPATAPVLQGLNLS